MRILNLLLIVRASCLPGDPRAFPQVSVFVNPHRFGPTNGCTGPAGSKGRLSCCHPQHVSEVEWTFLRSSPDGDIYRFTRRYPSDGETPTTAQKEIKFSAEAS